jgi:hypothetical protein
VALDSPGGRVRGVSVTCVHTCTVCVLCVVGSCVFAENHNEVIRGSRL